MENKQYPKIGLGVYILNDNNELLLFQRKSPHGIGSWCPPGGHLEYGESFADCAKRESKEEVGINIDNITILGVTNDIHLKENKHYITIAVGADIIKGKPRIMEPHKMKKLGWFPLDNLPSPLFLPVENFLKSKFNPF